MRQQNQLLIRALLLAVGVLATASPAGLAAPAAVHVRVEGLRATLFDRTLLTDGHDVRASSDATARRCDGTNGGAHADAGATATAATADALATRGETFDGAWNAGYEDYFIRRLGAESEDDAQLRWWGLLVNGAMAGAGGCQVRIGAGDEVLWANDAFSARPFLRLAAASAQPTAQLDAPLSVTVTASDGGGIAGTPYAGARVEAVDSDGRPAAAASADGSTSAADGSATVTFHAAGWQRVKARGPLPGGDPDALPAAIASNSIDVCVEATPGAGCSGQPPSQVPLTPPAPGPPPTDPPPTTDAPPALPPASAPPGRAAPAAPRTRPRPQHARRLAAPARLRLHRPAGRTTFTLRAISRQATIELRAARKRIRIQLTRRQGTRTVRSPRLRHRGTIVLRILRGKVCVANADPAGGAEDARAPVRRPGCAPGWAGSARTGPAGRTAGAQQNGAANQRLDQTVRFLQDAQNQDGGFGGSRGAPSDPTFTAWVALALAAAGVNPRDQARPSGTDAYAYLTAHTTELSATTDYERAALVAVAAGTDPRAFGGVDLVDAILARQLPSGAFAAQPGGGAGYVNATAFALLPLSALRDPALAPALARGADWLLHVQEASGAWGFAPGHEPSSDTTAAVLQALHAVGRGGTPQEARAWSYLRSLRNADGGYGFSDTHPDSNAASTAWVAQASWAAGEDPGAASAGGGPSALDYLASLQRPDGSIAWKAGDTTNAVWMTAYAAPAYAGRALPIAAVPRAAPIAAPAPASAPAEPTPAPVHDAPLAGNGGLGRAGDGVAIAGGDGDGAPLFSRPQPQSRGRTPGGMRDATGSRARTRDSARAGDPSRPGGPHAAGAAHGTASGTRVSGLVLGGRRAAAAPGLGAARAGGSTPGPVLPLALVGALLSAAGLGAQIERRRPGTTA